jgi:hypothetical protein
LVFPFLPIPYDLPFVSGEEAITQKSTKDQSTDEHPGVSGFYLPQYLVTQHAEKPYIPSTTVSRVYFVLWASDLHAHVVHHNSLHAE